jgi:thymidylate synthase (FAD)
MKIIESSAHIDQEVDGKAVLQAIEKAGRTSYKSEDLITDESAPKFVQRLITMGHESVLEHQSVTVRIICDRGQQQAITRQRLSSFTTESTRFINYSRGKFDSEITVIRPTAIVPGTYEDEVWTKCVKQAEDTYMTLVDLGLHAEMARSVLPMCTKSEMAITCNLRQWRYIFKLRTTPHNHPDMLAIMKPLLEEFKRTIPVIFDDL